MDEPAIGCGEDSLAWLREAPEQGGSGSVTRPQGHGNVLVHGLARVDTGVRR